MCLFPSGKDLLSSYWNQRQQSEDRLAIMAKANVGHTDERVSAAARKVWTRTKHSVGCVEQLDVWTKKWNDPPNRRWLLLLLLLLRGPIDLR